MQIDIDRSPGPDLAFEPEIVLPDQVFSTRVLDSPERQLMTAVLADAVSQFRQYSTTRTRTGRRLFAEAVDWLASDDQSWPYAYRNICDHLGIDAEALRAALARWATRQQHQLIDGIRVIRLRPRPPGGSRHTIAATLRRSA